MIDIAYSGDVILLVDQNERQKRLRVSSHMLRAASKTLNAMFGPHFREGQNLNPNEPKTVPLPDDDAEAMELICRMIHLQNDSIPGKMDLDRLLTLARLVDKYALQRTVHLAADRWIQPFEHAKIADLGKLMLAADLMNHEPGFQRITRALIYDTSGSYNEIAVKFPEADLWCAVFFLQSRRSNLRFAIERILKVMEYKLLKEPVNCQCSFREHLSAHCTRLLSSLAAHRPQNVTIQHILDQVKAIPDPDRKIARTYEQCPAMSVHAKSYQAFLFGHIGEHLNANPYLCLACTRAGKITNHNDSKRCPTKI